MSNRVGKSQRISNQNNPKKKCVDSGPGRGGICPASPTIKASQTKCIEGKRTYLELVGSTGLCGQHGRRHRGGLRMRIAVPVLSCRSDGGHLLGAPTQPTDGQVSSTPHVICIDTRSGVNVLRPPRKIRSDTVGSSACPHPDACRQRNMAVPRVGGVCGVPHTGRETAQPPQRVFRQIHSVHCRQRRTRR